AASASPFKNCKCLEKIATLSLPAGGFSSAATAARTAPPAISARRETEWCGCILSRRLSELRDEIESKVVDAGRRRRNPCSGGAIRPHRDGRDRQRQSRNVRHDGVPEGPGGRRSSDLRRV